jgi:uncharacterized 2Fe-2S/4Fe-4S cluster protein (DUF4445 family)
VGHDLIHAGRRIPLTTGRTLFDAADELAMVVPASCRRSGRCRECVVEVIEGAEALSDPAPEETFLRPGFRLACQARIEREPEGDIEFAVLRRRLRIFPPPSGPPLEIDPIVRVVDGRIRQGVDDIGEARGRLLGLALDVGTTTVVLEVVDLNDGASVAAGSFENPQRFGGSDVMSRIAYDADRPGELRQALRRALNQELRRLYAATGMDRREVVAMVVVGNSTMRDMFFGLDVAPIGRAPYRSTTETAWRAGVASTTAVERLAHELGILVHPKARIWGAPLIACHVGADAAADLVATGVAGNTNPLVPGTWEASTSGPGPRPPVAMMIDIGTNTEVIVSNGERILAASCPAGPAFEGGLVRHGMAGADGAIEALTHDGEGWRARTIGDVEPVGICGSGLVDLLAELRRLGWMAPGGAFAGGAREIVVDAERGISLTRADVSHLSQAKAANAAGFQIVLRRLGVRAEDVGTLHLAGGFASSLDLRNAAAIGFLPPVPPERVVTHGNASVRGAKALLLSSRARARLEALVGRIEHVELEAEPDFVDLFVEGFRFVPFSAAVSTMEA